MTSRRSAALETVERLEDIPAFKSEAEEHEFWSTHEFSDALWDQAEPFAEGELPPARPHTISVTLYLDANTLERLLALSRSQQREYHILLREFVTERLYEEEKRAGLLTEARQQ